MVMPLPALVAMGGVLGVVGLAVALLRGWSVVACNADLLAFVGTLVLLLPTVANEGMKWRKARLDKAIGAAKFPDATSREVATAPSCALAKAIADFAPWHGVILALGLFLLSLGFGLGAFGVAACPA